MWTVDRAAFGARQRGRLTAWADGLVLPPPRFTSFDASRADRARLANHLERRQPSATIRLARRRRERLHL